MSQEIPSNTPQEAYREQIPPIGPLSYQDSLLQNLFTERLSLQGDIENATPFIRVLDKYTFDSGMLQKREFATPDGELLEAEGVSIYNRAAFLARTEEIMRGKDFNGSFVLMDIAKFRDADMAEDIHKNKSADYILNMVGTKLIDTISQLKQEYLQKNKNIDIEIGRYGGDEIMFLINGIEESEKADVIQKLSQAATSVEGYYKTGEVQVPEHVGLKKVEQIDIPIDPFQRKVFEYYIPRGLILEPQEIANIEKNQKQEMEALLAHSDKPSIYPSDLLARAGSEEELMTIKKEYLIARHPELGQMFGSDTDVKAQKAMLGYIERVMYDPLLQEVVMGFTDLESHLSKGDYVSALIFDIKFIKEINDSRSIVEGDKAIQELWRQIREHIGDEDRTNYQIYRRGGTFVIACKNNTSDLQEKLTSLSEKRIKWNGIEIPLGGAHRDFADFNQQLTNLESKPTPTVESAKKLYAKKREMIRQEFGQMLRRANNNWQVKIGEHILEKMMEYGKPDVREVESKSHYTIDDLIYLYFASPKRGIERNQEAIDFQEARNGNEKLIQLHREYMDHVKTMKELSIPHKS
jgi:GGDEF domain-containing protein